MNNREFEQEQHRVYSEAVARNGWESKRHIEPAEPHFPDLVANTPEEVARLSDEYDRYVLMKQLRNGAQLSLWDAGTQGTLDLMYDSTE